MYAGELTLRLSSSWMYIAYTLYCLFLSPLCWWIDKKREKYLVSWVYICMFILFPRLCKRGKRIWWVCACLFLFMHICVVWFMHSIEYLYVYCYAWVKRELLWSLTLIHAYITPWVLSSSKRGDCWPRGLPLLFWWWLTHVVMFTNYLVMFSFRSLTKILVGD